MLPDDTPIEPVCGAHRRRRFESERRSYSALWTALLSARTAQAAASAAAEASAAAASAGAAVQQQQQQLSQQAPVVNVLGAGNVSALALPRELAGSVRVYRGLGFQDFYDTICRWALCGGAVFPKGRGGGVGSVLGSFRLLLPFMQVWAVLRDDGTPPLPSHLGLASAPEPVTRCQAAHLHESGLLVGSRLFVESGGRQQSLCMAGWRPAAESSIPAAMDCTCSEAGCSLFACASAVAHQRHY